MNELLLTVGFIVLQSLALLVAVLIIVAYLVYADRKIWAAVQMRRGPNVVGPWGLFQSFADMLKFVFKEVVIPDGANKGVFLIAPLVTCILALSAWVVVPVNAGWVVADINVGILFLFAISSLGVYGVIMGGWASNSKYPFLGALRSAAQMVSYEVSIGFVIVTVLICAGTLSTTMPGLGHSTSKPLRSASRSSVPGRITAWATSIVEAACTVAPARASRVPALSTPAASTVRMPGARISTRSVTVSSPSAAMSSRQGSSVSESLTR